MFFHTAKKTRSSSIKALVYLLRPCSRNKTFLWNLPGPLPTSAVTNEQYACFTVLNWPSGNLHKEMLGAVGVGWGRGSRNCHAEELGAKLSLALKEKFAQFPSNHTENIPQETQFSSHNLIWFVLALFAWLKLCIKSRRQWEKNC